MSRDEHYVIDLCDELLQEPGQRQHTFDWLRGDPNSRGTRRRLPVDCYWPSRRLVVEYREKQHYERVPHFDKPGKLTISGVHRGVQRAMYDARRDTLIPQNGLRLLVIRKHRPGREEERPAVPPPGAGPGRAAWPAAGRSRDREGRRRP